MIAVLHPTGNQNVRAIVAGLHSAGLLGIFATTLAVDPGASWLRFIPAGLQDELLRRSYAGFPGESMRLRPWREAVRLGSSRFGLARLTRHEVGWASVDAVYRDLDLYVATELPSWSRDRQLRGVYAYEDGALATFQAAHRLGLRRFYEQPIGHWTAARRILKEEAELQPDWAGTLTGNQDSDEKLARKDAELNLAGEIFVASSFTRHTLLEAGVAPEKIHLIPYGAPKSPTTIVTRRAPSGPLRVLFVGSLGQRKGLSYLLEAVRLMGPTAVELTLIGQPVSENCVPLHAALKHHRFIRSLPHAGVLTEMCQHDVFVFPSLFEGFGLVLLEAMAQGVPVIATPNTAGPDLIDDGVEGFIVPIRSAIAIADKLELLRSDRALLKQMGVCALRRAQKISWINYANKMVATLRASLEPVAG